ncbi:MAG: hypothetical protein D6738_08005, partial [Acidobacteria bacterium]
YPFERVASPRRPFRPLAPLPPALAAGWRPSGADLVREAVGAGEDGTADAGLAPPEQVSRVPIRDAPRPGATTVHYPFWRVTVETDDRSALWVDAIDGQVILPEAELARPATRDDGHAPLERRALQMLLAGIVAAILVPFPWSLLPLGVAGAIAWRGGPPR